jgi:hypothetical protein
VPGLSLLSTDFSDEVRGTLETLLSMAEFRLRQSPHIRACESSSSVYHAGSGQRNRDWGAGQKARIHVRPRSFRVGFHRKASEMSVKTSVKTSEKILDAMRQNAGITLPELAIVTCASTGLSGWLYLPSSFPAVMCSNL